LVPFFGERSFEFAYNYYDEGKRGEIRHTCEYLVKLSGFRRVVLLAEFTSFSPPLQKFFTPVGYDEQVKKGSLYLSKINYTKTGI
jgi:hypothetical protein